MLGETVAGLQLVALSGTTRAAELYLGECEDGRCAVKLVRAELATDVTRIERVFARARQVGALDHRGLEFVIEAGWDGARAYLLGDILPGRPASAILAGRAFEPDTARNVLGLAANALAAAHAAGVAHLALETTLVHVGFAADRVLVRDFGTDELVGPAFASRAPEQWDDGPDIGPAADVYALGCIAFEMLAGVAPVIAATAAEAAALHRALALPTLPGIPDAFGALIRRMVARDPAARPSMAEVRDELAGRTRTVSAPTVLVATPDVADVMAALAADANDEPTPPPGPPPDPDT